MFFQVSEGEKIHWFVVRKCYEIHIMHSAARCFGQKKEQKNGLIVNETVVFMN